jgi:hypothetical protein
MEQGKRWAVRGDHLRGGDYSAMLTLERCCHANSARGAAQSPHAWHVGDRKAVSRGVSKVSRSPSFAGARPRKLLLSSPCIRPSAAQGGWWGDGRVTQGLFNLQNGAPYSA